MRIDEVIDLVIEIVRDGDIARVGIIKPNGRIQYVTIKSEE